MGIAGQTLQFTVQLRRLEYAVISAGPALRCNEIKNIGSVVASGPSRVRSGSIVVAVMIFLCIHTNLSPVLPVRLLVTLCNGIKNIVALQLADKIYIVKM